MTNNRVKRQFIDTNNGQLHLRVAGHSSVRTPTVCLHMMPKSGRTFVPLMPELATDRLVVAPDYTGYGESEPLPEGITPSIDHYANSIIDALDHLELSKVDFVGYHTGSMVSVNIAKRLPERVRKIVQISAPVLTQQEVDQFESYYSPIELDEAGTRFSTMWSRIMHYRGPGMTLEQAAQSMAENLRSGSRYEDGHKAAFEYSQQYLEHLASLSHPIFIMNFGDDLHEHTKRVDAYLNNGHRRDFPQWGHGALALWPQEIGQQIRNFLD